MKGSPGAGAEKMHRNDGSNRPPSPAKVGHSLESELSTRRRSRPESHQHHERCPHDIGKKAPPRRRRSDLYEKQTSRRRRFNSCPVQRSDGSIPPGTSSSPQLRSSSKPATCPAASTTTPDEVIMEMSVPPSPSTTGDRQHLTTSLVSSNQGPMELSKLPGVYTNPAHDHCTSSPGRLRSSTRRLSSSASRRTLGHPSSPPPATLRSPSPHSTAGIHRKSVVQCHSDTTTTSPRSKAQTRRNILVGGSPPQPAPASASCRTTPRSPPQDEQHRGTSGGKATSLVPLSNGNGNLEEDLLDFCWKRNQSSSNKKALIVMSPSKSDTPLVSTRKQLVLRSSRDCTETMRRAIDRPDVPSSARCSKQLLKTSASPHSQGRRKQGKRDSGHSTCRRKEVLEQIRMSAAVERKAVKGSQLQRSKSRNKSASRRVDHSKRQGASNQEALQEQQEGEEDEKNDAVALLLTALETILAGVHEEEDPPSAERQSSSSTLETITTFCSDDPSMRSDERGHSKQETYCRPI